MILTDVRRIGRQFYQSVRTVFDSCYIWTNRLLHLSSGRGGRKCFDSNSSSIDDDDDYDDGIDSVNPLMEETHQGCLSSRRDPVKARGAGRGIRMERYQCWVSCMFSSISSLQPRVWGRCGVVLSIARSFLRKMWNKIQITKKFSKNNVMKLNMCNNFPKKNLVLHQKVPQVTFSAM